jgi:hypothetical protein
MFRSGTAPSKGYRMKWMQMYLVGYAIVLGGLVAALWKIGVIERIGTGWTAIGVAIAVGVGFMFSVANSGNKETVEIDQK